MGLFIRSLRNKIYDSQGNQFSVEAHYDRIGKGTPAKGVGFENVRLSKSINQSIYLSVNQSIYSSKTCYRDAKWFRVQLRNTSYVYKRNPLISTTQVLLGRILKLSLKESTRARPRMANQLTTCRSPDEFPDINRSITLKCYSIHRNFTIFSCPFTPTER